MPVAPASTSELLSLIQKSGVAPPDKFAAAVPDPDALPAEPGKAAGVLVQRGVITKFQAQQLMQGRHRGFRLGSHVILEQLGRGGMGVVYLAEHQELRRKVAIKVLVVGKDEDARLAAERFFREARAAAALDHPNIVRLFDVCRHNDTPYLVMEYVEGETLQQTLDREGPLPYAAAADAVAQAAAGLQHAHEKGFVHRDIKPGNLMRDRSGVVKLLDMGLARSATSEDKLTERLDAGAVVGTADFIAPEQALNSPSVDTRADIYSLGATFFALVSGKPPFEGNTTQKLLQHQMAPAPSLSKIDATLPRGLAGVVAKMLAKKPVERFQTPAEVIAALAPWLGNSARVLAGLSRTNLAAGADLHAKLHDKANSTGRLGRSGEVAVPDSGVINPADPAAETGAVASAQTARSETPKRLNKAARKGRRPVLPVVAGTVAVAAAAAGIAFALGAFDGPPAREQAKAPPPPPGGTSEPQKADPTPPKRTETPPAPPKKVEPPVRDEARVAYRLDLAGAEPFTTRGTSESNGMQGRDLRFVPGGRVGVGDFPNGWSGQTWDKDAEAEFSVAARAGRPALGVRNVTKRSAFLISPDVTFQTPAARVRFHYLTRSADPKVVLLKFKVPGLDNRTGLFEIGHLPGTDGAWRAFEQTVPLRGHRAVFFEWHTFDEGDDAGVFLAGFEATDAPESAEPVLARFDLTGLSPFAVRSTVDVRPDGVKSPRQLGRTGPGEPPAGWAGRCWNKDTHMEFFADAEPGVGIRNLRGPGSAMLFTPKVVIPTGLGRLRFDYSSTVREGGFVVRFKPDDKRGAWDVARPAATGPGAWAAADVVFDLKGATSGLFELHNNDPAQDAVLRVRAVAVSQPPAGTQPTPLAPAAGAARPAPADPFAGWAEGARVYRLDAAAVPTFRVTKESYTRTSGDPEQLPNGVSARCWKQGATGEFRRDEADGVAALGVTNFSDEKSGQFAFELEREMGLTLRPGAAYRVKVEYLTRNEAAGSMTAQTTDFKDLAATRFEGQAGAWRTAALAFERQADTPVRLTIDNHSVGEGNIVYFRSVEVVELRRP